VVDCYEHQSGYKALQLLTYPTRAKKRFLYDIDLSALPPGQRRAVEAVVGGGTDRTYREAEKIAGMAEGTLLTHINRIRVKTILLAVVRGCRVNQKTGGGYFARKRT
tara:strand:+ start:176 stop:496 length:321 start_codon:yes stop_codon:yes gene_type:complete